MALTRVWQSISIGDVVVANRVVRAANTTSVMPTGIDSQFIAYHLARARAGVGLTILEAAGVHHSSILNYSIDDAVCRGYEQLMRSIRPTGMRVFQQLWHGGHHLGANGQLPWAVCDIPSPFTGTVGLTMDKAAIEEVIEAFAVAARRCRESGIEGVELHAGHGYLVQQFLSPLTNTRADDYGGSWENRQRFAIEVLSAIRGAVGSQYPVGIRLSTSTAPGNVTATELAELARKLEQRGLIDYLNLSHGDYFALDRVTGTLADAAGYEIEPNRPILEAVRLPRLVTGRFRTLEEAEEVLRAGDAELVSLVRAHIADPELVRKTREGRVEQVRPCIACNQGCVGGLLTVARMGCAVNPVAGMEAAFDEQSMSKAATPARVLIVGGGPAGLEAARTAALRGHRVTLFEAAAQLGGAIDIARRAPRLAGIADITQWLEREVYRLGVEVRLGTFVDARDLRHEAADAVIIATGSQTRRDALQVANPALRPAGIDLPHVHDSTSLMTTMANKDLRNQTAVIVDDVGHYEGVAVAEFLVERGAQVAYVTSCASFAPRMHGTSRNDLALQYLYRGQFRLLVGHHLAGVRADSCEVRPVRGARTDTLAANLVVLVLHRTPARDIYDQLRGTRSNLHLVGDAASPRTLQEAIREGHMTARAL